MDVEESWSSFADCGYYVGAGAHRVAYIDAAADAGVHFADSGEDIKRGGEVLILWTVVVDAYADVVFLDKFFKAGKYLMGGCSDDERDACGFAVFELFSDIVVFVDCKSDRSGCG